MAAKINSLPKNAKPVQIKVIMYNVGFGDCFLLTFNYANNIKKQVLIDCGTSSEKKDRMTKVVNALVKDSNGKIDVLVVTHRHLDHLSAFNDKKLGPVLESLKPDLVIQPWTEHPKADKAALEAPSVYTKGACKRLLTLEHSQNFARMFLNNSQKLLAGVGKNTSNQLIRLASLSIHNEQAINRLENINKGKARHSYVYTGVKSGIEKILPGVKVFVLGPPTLKQTETIRKQTSWNEDEFWKLYSRLAAVNRDNSPVSSGKSVLFPKAGTSAISKSPAFNKWLFKKLDTIQLQNIQQIVRALDDSLNNTSAILLFKINDKALLFPGDAQLENWMYALGKQQYKKELKKVNLYKVGHHGSKNATPKTMWNILAPGSKKNQNLVSLISTKKGKHPGVPNKSLVEALGNGSDLLSTQSLGSKISKELIIEFNS